MFDLIVDSMTRDEFFDAFNPMLERYDSLLVHEGHDTYLLVHPEETDDATYYVLSVFIASHAYFANLSASRSLAETLDALHEQIVKDFIYN